MKFELVSFPLCPYVQRARSILIEKNIPYEVKFIDLDSPPDWFFDVSPLEKVPVLLVNDKSLFESLAICEYLDEISPNSLHPSDPFIKAQNRAWIEFANSLLSLTYDLILETEEVRFKQITASIDEKFDILEEDCLTGTSFFNGASFSIIDAIYAPVFRYHSELEKFHQFGFFEDRPQLTLWKDTLLAYPSVVNNISDSYSSELEAYLRKNESIFSSLM